MYYAFRANVDYDYPRNDESHPDQGRQIELLAEQYDGCQRDQHNPHAAPYRIGDPYGQLPQREAQQVERYATTVSTDGHNLLNDSEDFSALVATTSETIASNR